MIGAGIQNRNRLSLAAQNEDVDNLLTFATDFSLNII